MITQISGWALYAFSELVYRTCRFSIHGLAHLKTVQDRGGPVILVSWHGMTMMVAALIRQQLEIRNFKAIVPDDQRGDTLVVFCRKLGADPIPLDLSGDTTLGMSRKLVGLIRQIKAGRDFLIHPDGPAGPAYVVKPGATFLAQKSGAPILPLGCYCRHAYHVPRWDRYTLPLPFSKVHIQLGSMLTVPAGLPDLSAVNQELQDTLNRLTLAAAANYYQLGD